ncbi:MAG: aminodeoxychorismate/anthranilate synthase component II [Candidatus Dormiibacterota bacterium]
MNSEFLLPDRDLGDSVLVVDNYDSFTFNLVQRLGELGARCVVVRNDTATVAAIGERGPAAVVVSPGPKAPADAGISVELIRRLGGRVPLLGVCLGHQAIGEAYGGRVVRAPVIMHGKLSRIHHDGSALFAGVDDPFIATRYHSLVVEEASLPDVLEVTARTDDGVVMGLRHRAHPVVGVQFHPESIGTDAGYRILENFLELAGAPLLVRG